MHCPACSTEIPAGTGNRFCEDCGAPLSAQPVEAGGCACGASANERDHEGFCLRCGRKYRLPLPSDHVEEALSARFAAVSDRGLHHDRNEDRFGIFAGTNGCALVVCDGVSTSKNSEIASAAVAEGVLQSLSGALAQGPVANAEAVLRAAVEAGSSRLAATATSESRRITGSRKLRQQEANPASTTLVAALVTEAAITVAWVGDSRAYWIDEQSAGQAATPLTRDHSWQNDIVSAGEMSAAQAARSPKAHAITRWIGADSRCDPEFVSRPLTGPGTLLLCTDGLWNYAATPPEMAALVRESGAPGGEALALAQRLVAFALERGGHDNVSVAVLQIGQPENRM
jgi:serine/threonine protein phosphatase PrpC